MPIDTTKTGAAIAAHRQHMKLSQQGLAGLMNVTHQAVSKWEKGLALPDTETLLALAKLFGTSMENLLTGVLPQSTATQAENAPAEEPAAIREEPAEEIPSSISDAEFETLDFSAVMNMLPFVSTKAADHLFRTCVKNSRLDASALLSLAPFVSTGVISEYISTHPIKNSSPEVVASLAPFLSAKAVDDMILGMEGPLPPHVMQMLMPFASTRVVDRMVMGQLGIPVVNDPDESSDLSTQIQDKVHQKIMRKLEALEEKNVSPKHESPRMHLLRKAIENGYDEMIGNVFDELDTDEQLHLAQLLINGKMYSKLAEVIEELDEEVQHALLDKAFEINDPELLHIISEHL